MASSLIGGLLNANSDIKVAPENLMVFEPNLEKATELKSQFKIKLANDNYELINHADVVVLAVKPQVLENVLKPLADAFKESKPLIVSIAAGITISSIEHWLNDAYAVVRVMPNTPALVGAGASGLYANERVSQEQRHVTEALLNAVGMSRWVNHEPDIDAVTALSGSGPAYFMLFINSLIEAGQAAGLDHATAKALAVATASGSAKLIEESNQPLQTLIDNVTSPGGTTEQALKSFHSDKLPAIIGAAFESARVRSKELADQLGSSKT